MSLHFEKTINPEKTKQKGKRGMRQLRYSLAFICKGLNDRKTILLISEQMLH